MKSFITLASILLLLLPFYINHSLGRIFFPGRLPILELPDLINALSFTAALYLIVFRHAFIPQRYIRSSLLPSYYFPSYFGAMWGILTLALAIALLKNIYPETFAYLASEDGWVENTTVFLLFGACILLIKTARYAAFSKNTKGLLYLLALYVFICGGEEISWGQRIFGFSTPEGLLLINKQQEFNIHNIYTKLTDVLYYWVATGFLIILPFLHATTTLPSSWLRPFVPITAGRYSVFCACVLCCLNNNEWNCLYIELMFFTVLYLLLYLATRQPFSKAFLVFLSGYSLINMVSMYGYNYNITLWYMSEYRECYVALAYFVYSLELQFRVKKTQN